MNLHELVSGAIGMVNPPVTGSMKIATGYTTGGDGTRTPTYDVTDGVAFQVQALTAKEIDQLASLNITGILQAVHVSGFLEALDRDANKGGDLIIFDSTPDIPAPLAGTTWLVSQVLERWPASGWCRVAIKKQLS